MLGKLLIAFSGTFLATLAGGLVASAVWYQIALVGVWASSLAGE